jgi:hypothetical protein
VFDPVILSTPHTKGSRVRDAQWLLSGHNRFSSTDHPVHPYKGKITGVFDEETAHAANRARYVLGYPKNRINTDVFGEELFSYLIPKTSKNHRLLPKAYRLRRAARIRLEARRRAAAAKNTVKKRSLALAKTQIGYHEAYSNKTKYGEWYGFNGVAWCAIFVSWCLSHSGKPIKTALAYQWEYWARAKQNGLSITYNPEPGDLVVFHIHDGHVGLFDQWVDRASGHFLAVEGNSLNAVSHRERWTSSSPCVFVKVS